ncbi:MAG: SDR family oxidoreductase [Lachnospiraceae bacterium]
MTETKKSILLTGATSGIGLAVGRRLALEGCLVFGLGRTTEKVTECPEKLRLLSCDVTDTNALRAALRQIRGQLGGYPDVVIHCAGVGYYGLQETLSEQQIKELVRTNLEAPILLTTLLLPSFKQRGYGHVIFLSSVTAEKTNPHGATYGATKAALTSFAASLFEEVRKNGIKVTTIQPDMTKSDLYRNADFTADEDACLFPEDIAEAVSFLLSQPEHLVTTKLTVQPQKHRIKKKEL